MSEQNFEEISCEFEWVKYVQEKITNNTVSCLNLSNFCLDEGEDEDFFFSFLKIEGVVYANFQNFLDEGLFEDSKFLKLVISDINGCNLTKCNYKLIDLEIDVNEENTYYVSRLFDYLPNLENLVLNCSSSPELSFVLSQLLKLKCLKFLNIKSTDLNACSIKIILDLVSKGVKVDFIADDSVTYYINAITKKEKFIYISLDILTPLSEELMSKGDNSKFSYIFLCDHSCGHDKLIHFMVNSLPYFKNVISLRIDSSGNLNSILKKLKYFPNITDLDFINLIGQQDSSWIFILFDELKMEYLKLKVLLPSTVLLSKSLRSNQSLKRLSFTFSSQIVNICDVMEFLKGNKNLRSFEIIFLEQTETFSNLLSEFLDILSTTNIANFFCIIGQKYYFCKEFDRITKMNRIRLEIETRFKFISKVACDMNFKFEETKRKFQDTSSPNKRKKK
eukprot:gene1681-450_t